MTTLGDVFEIVGGATPRTDERSFWGGDIPWVTPDDLARHEGIEVWGGRRTITSAGFASTSTHLLPKGSVLFSSRAPIGYVAIAARPLCTNQGFKSLIPPEGVDARYVYWYLRHATPAIRGMGSGTTFKEMSKKRMAAVPFVMAPSSEQRRIVVAIEEHLSRLGAAVDASSAAATKATAMRRSILLEALSGRLSMRVPGAEPASILLGRISASRAQFRGGPRTTAPTAEDGESSSPHELPPGWIWARLQDVAAAERRAITDGPFGSNLKTAHYTESGPRVIRLQNIGDGEFKHEDAHISPSHYESLLAHSVKKDDLIVASLGDSLPRACLVPDWVPPAIVKADCIRIRIHPEVNPAYINLALQHPQLRRETMVKIKGVGRPRLGMQGIRQLVIPLAPRAEQQRIVAAVEEHFSRADAVRDTVSASLAKVDAMRRIVLSEAFAGRLVPQDPDEEPATTLLERISELKPT